MREIGIRKLILEMEFKPTQPSPCFGTKEFNERSDICKSCDELEECQKKAKL